MRSPRSAEPTCANRTNEAQCISDFFKDRAASFQNVAVTSHGRSRDPDINELFCSTDAAPRDSFVLLHALQSTASTQIGPAPSSEVFFARLSHKSDILIFNPLD